ncbi:hypothetical protein, partial [Pantoea agglomerans]|uniref:hypothetical protein n=1 Tax=Enterobacter agglomerans TaxID=549 RepID=UPI003207B298
RDFLPGMRAGLPDRVSGDLLPASEAARSAVRALGLLRQEYYGQGPVILMREADTVFMNL